MATPRRGTETSSALSICLFLAATVFATATASRAQDSSYRIGPKDLIHIEVFEVPELTGDLRVADDGNVDLPLVGHVQAQGLTESELVDTLKTLLELKYVQRASVRVEVLEFRSQPISVIGAVKRPGQLAFSGRWTLLEAITAAGGLEERHGNVIYVLRTAPNGLSDRLEIQVEDLMLRADPTFNIPIVANDMINIPAPITITLFCLGEIQRPGAIEFLSNERITVLSAIARAGGPTNRASKTILIKRQDSSGKATEIKVHYGRIIDGKDPDIELKANDVIIVKSSFF